jgi:hypothetical protein
MAARTYQPSGQHNDGVLPMLVLGCAGAAIAVGVVEGLVSSFINLLVIFPIVIGVVAGAVASRKIKSGHMRAPLLVAVIAGLAAGTGQVAVYGTRYVTWQHKVVPEIEAELANNGGGDARAQLEAVLQEKTGHTGFVGFLVLNSQVGVEIQHNGSKGPLLTGVGYWIYFGVEMLFALATAVSIAWSAASQPYCESCKQWYERRDLVGSGSGEKAVTKQVIATLDGGRWRDVGAALGTATDKTIGVISLLRCAGCTLHEPQLTYTVTTRRNTKKPQSNVRFKTMLRADEAAELQKGVTTPAS